MFFSFVVNGEGENPCPYTRTTYKQKYVKKSNFPIWKNKVITSFVKKYSKYPHMVFQNNKKYYILCISFFKDNKHGDPDNIAKGVNDSLFNKPLNDKYIVGIYDYFYDAHNPRCEIVITDDLSLLLKSYKTYYINH